MTLAGPWFDWDSRVQQARGREKPNFVLETGSGFEVELEARVNLREHFGGEVGQVGSKGGGASVNLCGRETRRQSESWRSQTADADERAR